MAYVDVAASSDVTEGKPAVAYIQGIDLVVFRVGSTLHATDRWCPHARGDLSDGALDGCQLTCPDHGWSFSIDTGSCHKKSGGRPISVYPCREQGGRIEVDLG